MAIVAILSPILAIKNGSGWIKGRSKRFAPNTISELCTESLNIIIRAEVRYLAA
jgi:hypothetical protein